ncbi:MAG: tetratricopeptide repeat protein [Novosphingobium sp.]
MSVQTVRRALALGLCAGLPLAAVPAMAQQRQMAAPQVAVSRPVVQAVPGAGSQSLNNALARLGRDPKDVNALIDAGNAALGMGDVDAALGFFARADQLSPNNPRVRAGLGGALVRSGNPYEAIPLFAEAEAAGGMDASLGTERGLAYDLVGDNATAQRYYRAALSAGENDEATRRLALSLAISGDEAGMETALAPLLQKQDKAAWRTRAFALAVLNQPDEAVQIAYQTMPKDLAAGIAPYLRYMPRLTKAQQAAAATFGHFPRAAEIGHDDPRALPFAPPVRVASADAGLVPKGEPLGRKGRSSADARSRDGKQGGKSPTLAVATPPTVSAPSQAPRTAPPELQPRRDESEAPSRVTTPTVAVAAPTPQQVPQAAVPRPVTPTVAVAARPAPRPIGPGFDLAQTPGASTVAIAPPAPAATPPIPAVVPQPTPAPQPAPALVSSPTPAPPPAAPPAPPPRKFADLFGDLLAPASIAAPAPGAVDIRKLKPAAPKVEAPVKPAHPSRIWIQVGTGRDKSALAFSWKAILREDPDLFRGKSPAISEWGRTNRLLVGPFESEAAANSFYARLRKAKVDSFLWTSPAGQIVDPLQVK